MPLLPALSPKYPRTWYLQNYNDACTVYFTKEVIVKIGAIDVSCISGIYSLWILKLGQCSRTTISELPGVPFPAKVVITWAREDVAVKRKNTKDINFIGNEKANLQK